MNGYIFNTNIAIFYKNYTFQFLCPPKLSLTIEALEQVVA